MAEYVIERPYYYPAFTVSRIINGIFGLIEFMLVLRFVLEVLGASPAAPFIAWVYGVTNALVAPFAGAFATFYIGTIPIDVSVIIAMIGYALIGWLILRLLSLMFISAQEA